MSYETASSSSSRSIPPPVLPPFLHLTSPQENNDSSNRPGGSKFTIKRFRRAFHHIVFPRQFDTVGSLERVAEATAEDENAVCSSRPSNSLKRRTPGRPASRPSTTSIVSQSTASHISTPQHSPRTLIMSFPPVNVSDIPPRSPTNKSPFSAVLLAGEDEEREEDDPALALWHTEQLHRARLAKLTRHLGEDIPAEMVLSPTFLSRGTSRSVHSRRGGYHHKRRSLDPSTFVQESPVTGFAEGVLRRSKSLKGQGDTHPTLSVTGTTSKTPSTEYIVSEAHSPETTMNMVAIPNPSPFPSTIPETHSNPPVNIPNGDVPRARASMDTYSDNLLSRSSRSSVETSPFYHRASHVPSKSRTLPRRPATADASRRVEKLANFFGVDHEDISAVAQAHGTAQKLQFSPTSAAGDPGIGIHAPDSQLEVEVKVSRPTRFWNGRATTKSVRPDDVTDKLRMMRAS